MANATMNRSGLSLDIPLCDTTDKLYMSSPIEHGLIAIGIIIIVLNVLHLIALTMLVKPKITVFYYTLYLITANDIVLLSSTVIALSRQYRSLYSTYPCILKTFSCVLHSSVYFQYCVILFAIIDRWLVLCTPFKYAHHIFVTRYPYLAMLSATVCALYSSGRDIFAVQHMCLHTGYGLLSCKGGASQMLCSAPLILFSLLLFIFTGMFIFEYVKFTRRFVESAADENLKLMTRYVLLSTIVFIVNVFLVFVLLSFKEYLNQKTWFTPFSTFVMMTNAINNIIVFFCTMKSYRLRLREIFLCHRCVVSRVQPDSQTMGSSA